ncbi:hypothetical protein K488DRAFT_73146 [Vararia minispora EC-137]|uniref:Uncharacterized protein n=1 Tax=Vararia minispora EC-137 TaxID=1314806 RepID=A0ACB8QBN2_9AGAM|nr:hypothetical protein K488DRAFT_73146 [Vararia minispora EC-137]
MAISFISELNGVVRSVHVVLGLILWEFFTYLGFDWSMITGKRRRRWVFWALGAISLECTSFILLLRVYLASAYIQSGALFKQLGQAASALRRAWRDYFLAFFTTCCARSYSHWSLYTGLGLKAQAIGWLWPILAIIIHAPSVVLLAVNVDGKACLHNRTKPSDQQSRGLRAHKERQLPLRTFIAALFWKLTLDTIPGRHFSEALKGHQLISARIVYPRLSDPVNPNPHVLEHYGSTASSRMQQTLL